MKRSTRNSVIFSVRVFSVPFYSLFICTIFLFILSGFLDSSLAPSIQTDQDLARAATTISYCQSKATNTAKGYIEKVSIETINNSSGNNGGYADFTNLSASLQKGATYSIELTPGFVNGAPNFEYWTVYIDYNHDGIFEPGEMIEGRHAAIRIVKSFTVPAGALTGNTRMRIQMQEGSQQTNPCAVYTYGEVEDYTINITGSFPIAGQAQKNSEENSLQPTLSLSPNPSEGASTRAGFTLTKNGDVNLKVIDMNGAVVHNVFLGNQTAGKHDYMLADAVSGLRKGFYVLVLEQDRKIIARAKFIVSH